MLLNCIVFIFQHFPIFIFETFFQTLLSRIGGMTPGVCAGFQDVEKKGAVNL